MYLAQLRTEVVGLLEYSGSPLLLQIIDSDWKPFEVAEGRKRLD
jgi:hypothetical protein